MKNWILLALLVCSCTAVGCGGHSDGVVANPDDVNKYVTPPDAQAEMAKAQAEAASKNPGN